MQGMQRFLRRGRAHRKRPKAAKYGYETAETMQNIRRILMALPRISGANRIGSKSVVTAVPTVMTVTTA